MLSLMRKHATSWLIKTFMAIIAVVFVFWGVGSFRDQKANKYAEVNGEVITATEVSQVYQNLLQNIRRQYGEKLTPELIAQLKLEDQALDRIIEGRLIIEEADRLHLKVTDAEVQEKIQEYPLFQENGHFDQDRYFRLLSANRITPAEFEMDQRRSILTERLRQVVSSTVVVGESEALERFRFEKEEAVVDVVNFDSERYLTNVNPTTEEVSAYFEKNKQRYALPEKSRIGYVLYRPEAFTDLIRLSPQEIEDYYNGHLDDFQREKEVRARHILFKVPKGASPAEDEAVRNKALEVLKKIRDGGADFAETARAVSEGPSAPKGGDLGFFRKGDMVKPFEDAAFSMKPGEIRGPVKTEFGYHLIKVEEVKDARAEPLDEVKGRIEEIVKTEQARDLAFEAAEDDVDQAIQGTSLKKLAEARGLEYKESEPFTADGTLPGLQDFKDITSTAFSLSPGEIGPLMTTSNAALVFTLIEKQPSEVPPLDEIRKQVSEDLAKSLAREQAEAAAVKFLKEVEEGKDYTVAAYAGGLEIKQYGPFQRRGAIEDLGYVPDLNRAVFALGRERGVVPEPVKYQGRFLAVRLVSIKYPEKSAFETEKKEYMDRLLAMKQAQRFQGWIEALKKRAQIEVFKGRS